MIFFLNGSTFSSDDSNYQEDDVGLLVGILL